MLASRVSSAFLSSSIAYSSRDTHTTHKRAKRQLARGLQVSVSFFYPSESHLGDLLKASPCQQRSRNATSKYS
eukprot:1812558-Pyramimonas_sp.AAC.2